METGVILNQWGENFKKFLVPLSDAGNPEIT